MAILTGKSIASTYKSLLNVSGSDNAELPTNSVTIIEDGAGNDSSLSLGTDRATITLGSDAGDDFIVDGTKLVVQGNTGKVGIGTSTPEGNLHILSGSAGTVTAHADADELVIEGSGNTGLSVLCPDGSVSELVLGSDDDNLGAAVQWSDSNELMTITTHLSGGDIRFVTGAGTPETMRMLQDGKVGIGTTTPDNLLEVSASGSGAVMSITSYDDDSTDCSTLQLQTADGTEGSPALIDDNEIVGQIKFRGYTDAWKEGAIIRARASGTPAAGNDMPTDLEFCTAADGAVVAGDPQMIIQANGKVGIGTATPSSALEVNGAFRVSDEGGAEDTKYATQHWNDSDDNYYINAVGFPADTNRIGFQIDGTSKMSIRKDGRVGIGTATPIANLHVSGTSTSDNNPILTIESTDAGADTGPDIMIYRNSSSPAVNDYLGTLTFRGKDLGGNDAEYVDIYSRISNPADGSESAKLYFRVADNGNATNDALMIDGSKVGIGTTSPAAALHVASDPGDNQEVAYIQNSHSSIDAGDMILQLSFSAQDNCTDGVYINFHDSGGSHGNIDAASSTAVAYNTTSDYRLKENAKTISDALTRVCNLKPYSLNYKAAPGVTIDAFYAHEVQEVVPYVVRGEKDAVDSDGKIDPQMLDHSRLVPLLAAAIQELSAKVTALESA